MLAYAKDDYEPEDSQDCFGWYDPEGKRAGGKSKAGSTPQSRHSAISKAIDATGLVKKLLAQRPNARLAPRREHGINATEYSLGVAVMFSGTVTVTSMEHHVEYNQGMLEYVTSFVGTPEAEPPKKGIVVKPYTYDIVLTSHKSSYGGEGKVDEGYYKEEEHKGGDEYYPKEGHGREGYYPRDEGYEEHERYHHAN